jgi:bifunctional NMN adenylyltransferase/nudix hydrolase
MRLQEESYDVGVIVGRFQVPELHDAHKDLIETVCDKHDKVVIFLGLSPLMVTRENPLDFESRKQMILEQFPDVIVLYAKDMPSDEVWSKRLDEMIGDVTTPHQSVVLYGGRDSFISHYSGKYPTAELVQDVYVSGNEIRKSISRKRVKADPMFRAGVVWASQAQFPTAYTTVDVAVFNEDETRLLLARKEFEKEYRLIGGFSDPRSPSFEADARREVQEEAGIAITDPVYVASFQVDDWRYRKEIDCIKTLLFKAKVLSGRPRPDDDIVEVRWFDVSEIKIKDIRPEHREMITKLIGLT